MLQKLALKRLTASDLTFFQWHYINRPAGNQKAINLNADVFVDKLYPSMPSVAARQGDRLSVDLFIFGPGLAGECNFQRKIVKGRAYKNWRLNGETIHDPDDQSERFNILAPNDFAVFSFQGEIVPLAASIYFVAASRTEDAALHREFTQLMGAGRISMMALSEMQLQQVIHDANPPTAHPLRDLLLGEALEDAAQNGIQGIQRLRTCASVRRISQELLREARENAGRIGRRGEEFVYEYLIAQRENQRIVDFRWVADENAISPYDFEVDLGDKVVHVDVKATEGAFDGTIHISYNELLQMRKSVAYELYRVYDMADARAQMRIARNMKAFAGTVLAILEQLPENVRADSISVSPRVLPFEPPVSIEIPDDEE